VEQEKKSLFIKYIVCFVIASLIAVLVFWQQGFFTDRLEVNIQILSDGFFVSGMVFLMVSGMLFVSGEGALIGISFVMRNIILTFIPMGRKHQETYKQYRERKIGKVKKSNELCILFTGLFFLLIGAIFSIIYYKINM
jgi:hypothetical protein